MCMFAVSDQCRVRSLCLLSPIAGLHLPSHINKLPPYFLILVGTRVLCPASPAGLGSLQQSHFRVFLGNGLPKQRRDGTGILPSIHSMSHSSWLPLLGRSWKQGRVLNLEFRDTGSLIYMWCEDCVRAFLLSETQLPPLKLRTAIPTS